MRSSRCCGRICTRLSTSVPSSTARRTKSPRQRTMTWTWTTWRASHWTRLPTPRDRRTQAGTKGPRWPSGGTMTSTSPTHTWTVARKTDESYRCPDPALPNISCFRKKTLFNLPLILSLFQSIFFLYLSCSSHHFSNDFRILGEALQKRNRSQDFLFSSSRLPHTGRRGMQTWCNSFLTSSATHRTFYYRITYLLFFTIATFPGLLVMETEKTQNCEHNKP